MTSHRILNKPRITNAKNANAVSAMFCRVGEWAARRPASVMFLLLGTGALLLGGGGVAGALLLKKTQGVDNQQAQVEAVRREYQREINALAARMGELQAEANRLNALGERLTRVGQLEDGEFDFDKPVGVGGGSGPVKDMPKDVLEEGLNNLDAQFDASGEQLSVLESLLFDRQLAMNSVPSRVPIDNSYITSNFGGRADPIRGGYQFHKGIDFEADVGDPVLAVADGVISFSGARGGYGNTIEIDHGNGLVTRYGHNSRLMRRVGELVRAGQEVAKAGSTGRSTGAHVHLEVWQNGRVVNPKPFLAGKSPLRG